MTNKPARIVLDLHTPTDISWCWRDDWFTGWDSAYGLISKFAKLNALTAGELAQLFVSSSCGRKTAIVKAPDLDLRLVGSIDVNRLAQVLRIETDSIKKSFVTEIFPNSRRKALPYLKWCPECMENGFHSSIQQLEFLGACPVHGTKLISVCPQCHRVLPYQLSREMFKEPFSCPGCGYDLAPSVKDPSTRSLALCDGFSDRLEDVTNLIKYEDKVLVLAFEMDRDRWRDGLGHFVLAGADVRREHNQYAGFVSAIVDLLQSDRLGQKCIPLEDIDCIQRRPWTPLPLRKKRGRGAIAKQLDTGSNTWEAQAASLDVLYRAVRRHFWRRIVGTHKRCCESAAHALWWHMEGERTVNFCAIAEAFIRWRMLWEFIGIPNHLLLAGKSTPRGISAWIDGSAPIFRFGWSPQGELWVTGHIFAMACLSSFLDLIDAAIKNRASGEILWNKPILSGKYDQYWAITGNDTAQQPLKLFHQIHMRTCLTSLSERYRGDMAHYLWHCSQVRKIVR